MTSANASDEAPYRAQILKPYRSASDTPGHRRAKRWALAALAVFCLFWGLVFAFLAPALIAILLAPVGILLLLVLWAAPDEGDAPTRTLEFCFFACTATLIVWPFYLSVSIPNSGLPWITPLRLLSVLMDMALLVGVAVSKEFRGELAKVLRGERVVTAMIVTFLVVQTCSVALSNKPFASLNKWLDAQILGSASLFVACYVFSKPGRAVRWAAIVWATALFVGLIGVWELRLNRVPWFGHLPPFIHIDPLVLAEMAPSFRGWHEVYRVQSTFQGPLGLGEFLALAMPFVLHFALQPGRRWLKAAAALSVAFLFYIVFVTHARSGMIGVLIDFGLYGFYWGVTEWTRRKDSMIGPAVVLTYPALAAAAVASTFIFGRVNAAVWGAGGEPDSNLARQSQWAMGLPMILKDPIGHGVGRAAETLGYRELNGMLTIDNYYLSVALEYGVVGFIAFFGMFLYSSYLGGRNALADHGKHPETTLMVPASIALMAFIVIKSVYSEEMNLPLFYMLVGMILALLYRLKFATANEAATVAIQPAEFGRAVLIGARSAQRLTM